VKTKKFTEYRKKAWRNHGDSAKFLLVNGQWHHVPFSSDRRPPRNITNQTPNRLASMLSWWSLIPKDVLKDLAGVPGVPLPGMAARAWELETSVAALNLVGDRVCSI